MIGLHSGQRGNSVNLSELIYVINNPDQFKEKVDALNTAAQKHRDAMEASHRAKQEHDAAAAQSESKAAAAEAAAADLNRRQTLLNDTLSKIDSESRRLEIEKNNHAGEVAAHKTRVEEHGVKVKALNEWERRAADKEKELQQRTSAVLAAETEIFRAATRVRELLPK